MPVYHVTIDGEEFEVGIDGHHQISIGGVPIDTDIKQVDGHQYSMLLGGKSFALSVMGSRGTYDVQSSTGRYLAHVKSEREQLMQKALGPATTHSSTRFEILAPMPSLVVRLEVSQGDAVVAGQGLLVLEAMKMENEIKAPSAGIVRSIHVTQGLPVDKNELLIVLE